MRSQKSLSILVIDIDYFKRYNDEFGHILGDICLIRISDVIKACTRRSSDLAARFGGEEFVVVLGETSLVEAMNIAKMLCEKIAQLAIPSANKSVVTASIGVSNIMPSQDTDEIALMMQADAALYMAKNNGRNRVEAYTEI
jgi:diguanylate cyclase (GGDEF)-like protein